MYEDFILPDIGEGIVECEVVTWYVQEGEAVLEDQVLADVMTDKVTVEIPALHNGVLTKHYYQKGEIAKVGKPLYQIQIEGLTAVTTQTTMESKQAIPPQLEEQTVCSQQPLQKVQEQDYPQRALATPAVRRIAREQQIDLLQVQGSGKGGRVLKEDLTQFQACSASAVVCAETVTSTLHNRVENISGIRAAMAKQMTAANQIPHFTYVDELNLNKLAKLRAQLKPALTEQGIQLSFLPFFMKALALAIAEFPILNAKLNADCTELTYLADINIGIAMDTPIGLLVPNIKSVQTKSILHIAQELTALIAQARSGKLNREQLTGGTITLSNIGALGGTVATPIINGNEMAICALGKLQRLPRFNKKGKVRQQQLMNLCWSGDHRVLDGGTIARFNNLWRRYLEQPETMLLQLN